MDLIQVWDDLHFVSRLRAPLQRFFPIGSPEFNCTYAEILSKNPDLVSALRVSMLWPPRPTFAPVLELLGLTWEILRPMCVVRDWKHGDLLVGNHEDFLLDFLCHPLKVQGGLAETMENTALRCISRIKGILISTDFFKFDRCAIQQLH